MEQWHLMVGLGNPGRRYARTRHNAGFMAVARWVAPTRAKWQLEKKFKARLAWVETDDRRVLACQPETFMNASGEAVGALVGFYKIGLDRLMVVVDDADLPLGTLRLRPEGSSGGHHGLESIEQHLGSRQFARLRLGIGRIESGPREITGHVLAEFAPGEGALWEKVLERAASQVDCWVRHGVARAMNEFNGVITT